MGEGNRELTVYTGKGGALNYYKVLYKALGYDEAAVEVLMASRERHLTEGTYEITDAGCRKISSNNE